MTKSPNQSATRFGAELRAMMEGRRIRGADLSVNLGVSVSYVSAIATGSTLASAQTADRFATAIAAGPEERLRLHRAAAEDAGFRLELPEDF